MPELMQDLIANPRHPCNIIALRDSTLLNLKPVHALSNSETVDHATLPNFTILIRRKFFLLIMRRAKFRYHRMSLDIEEK